MRSFTLRSVNRPRPVLTLETLEDRCVLSAGGLLTALSPLATAGAAHSPLYSTLTSLVAVPTTVLSSVGTTVQDLGTTVQDLGTTVLAGPVKAAAVDVPLNLNVDVPFLHVDNLRLDVAVNPIGSDQPLVTLAVGGKVAAGASTDAPVTTAPEVQLNLGASGVVSPNVSAPITVAVGQGIGDVPPSAAPIPAPVSSSGAGLNLIPLVGNTTSPTVSNSPATLPALIFGVPPSSALLLAPDAMPVDGGGSSGVDAAALGVPVTGVAGADGAGGVVAAKPIDLGGGTDAEIVLVNPDLEAPGLTTTFQPYSLDGAGQNLARLFGRLGPQSGWLAAWLARLSHVAPWLAGLIAAGAALEIRRRRAARAVDRSLAE